MMKKVKQIINDKRWWGAALFIFWWFDFQTAPASSLKKALVLSFNHLFVIMMTAGVVLWVLHIRKQDNARRDFPLTPAEEPKQPDRGR